MGERPDVHAVPRSALAESFVRWADETIREQAERIEALEKALTGLIGAARPPEPVPQEALSEAWQVLQKSDAALSPPPQPSEALNDLSEMPDFASEEDEAAYWARHELGEDALAQMEPLNPDQPSEPVEGEADGFGKIVLPTESKCERCGTDAHVADLCAECAEWERANPPVVTRKPYLAKLEAVVEAARDYEAWAQQIKGAVLTSFDVERLNALQTRLREALAALDGPEAAE